MMEEEGKEKERKDRGREKNTHVHNDKVLGNRIDGGGAHANNKVADFILVALQ